MGEPTSSAHRRRRRATSAQGAPPARPEPPVIVPQPTPPVRVPSANKRDVSEPGLRDIVGAGRSRVGVVGAMRGRDVNRPSDDDLAEAERELAVVRRHWAPPTSPGKQ